MGLKVLQRVLTPSVKTAGLSCSIIFSSSSSVVVLPAVNEIEANVRTFQGYNKASQVLTDFKLSLNATLALFFVVILNTIVLNHDLNNLMF